MNTLERIKQLMDQRGWTLYRLAKESGVLHSTLTNMFNRNNDPSISTLESLCKGFGITMLQFFSNESNLTTTLTPKQKEMLDNWSKLDENQQKILLDLMKSM